MYRARRQTPEGSADSEKADSRGGDDEGYHGGFPRVSVGNRAEQGETGERGREIGREGREQAGDNAAPWVTPDTRPLAGVTPARC